MRPADLLPSASRGKSERVSRRFPTWLLAHNPNLRIGVASYELETARRWGRTIRDDLRTFDGTEGQLDLGIRLRSDSNAADRWQIAGHRGGLKALGIGGAWTGWPLDGLVIDDPFKDWEQANSPAHRERVWNWLKSVVIPRLAPGGWIIVVNTRWHEEDLTGKATAEQPGRWRVLNIPALAESGADPLGRRVGEWLESARQRTAEQWAQIRADVGEWVWAALYQGRPAPAEGGLFRRVAWKYWTPLHGTYLDMSGRMCDTRDCWRFATVDLAASVKTSADWSVVSAWAIPPGGDCLILLDRARARLGETDHWALLRPLRDRWGLDTAFVEKSFITSTLVKDATRAGLPISPLDPETDKLTRAIPASALLDAGGVWLPAGASWLGEWIEEHAGFPNGAHDDQVDTLAYAARVRSSKWQPPVHKGHSNGHSQEIDWETVPM
jgi:predicted phage terminase large subunit-like protein